MASIIFAIGANTKTFTVSAGDTARIIAALTAEYGPGLTNAQIFDIWANNNMRALREVVKRVEGDAAATAARAAVVDVVAT